MLKNRAVATLGLAVGLALTGCGGETAEAAPEAAAVVEEIEGESVSRITLTAHAAERLAIETAAVSEAGPGELAVPFSAIFWDADGQAWTYTSPETLVFVRAPVVVESVDGDEALLTEGPAAGTTVVTLGVAELYGTETGVGGGH